MNKAGPSRRADGARWRYAMRTSARVAQDDMRGFLLKEEEGISRKDDRFFDPR